MKIGWIGFGSVGTEMAKKALQGGHELRGYARGAGLGAAQAAGAKIYSDYKSVAAGSDILGLCVFSGAQLEEVLLDGGALSVMAPGSVVVIHTTTSPELVRRLGTRAPEGVSVIDATFSGGPPEAIAGTITLVIGGDAGAIERSRPLLDLYADTIHHVGPLGQGQVVKLLNNLLYAANLKNAVDILRLAEAQGLDTQYCARILQDCSGRSFAMGLFENATLEFMLDVNKRYMKKDVVAALDGARRSNMDVSAFAPTEAFATS